MSEPTEEDLFGESPHPWDLPDSYTPKPAPFFLPDVIILAKGSLANPKRERFVRRVCSAYPQAKIVEQLGTAHNRIDLKTHDPLDLHRHGKRILVLGELKDAVRFSKEADNTCPNYWHYSLYGFCPYGCQYCYLAGTHSVWFSPTVKIYVNLPEILDRIDRTARRLARPVAFYHGKLQDGLAMEPLTAYSTVTVPFFARHPFARQVLLTKSASVERLLKLDHRGRTILSWSLNPPLISERYEQNVPSIQQRLTAMRQCADANYPIRVVIMPLIPHPDWQRIYVEFIEELLRTVPLERLTLGGICIYRQARHLMEHHLGRGNPISQAITTCEDRGDGRGRYDIALRAHMYKHIIQVARAIKPNLDLALCLEEPAVWDQILSQGSQGRCNCVL